MHKTVVSCVYIYFIIYIYVACGTLLCLCTCNCTLKKKKTTLNAFKCSEYCCKYNSSLVNSVHLRLKLSLISNHSWYIHDGAKPVPVCNWAILTNALNISCAGVGLHWINMYELLWESVRRPGVSSIDIPACLP